MADVFKKQKTDYVLADKPVPAGTPGAVRRGRYSAKYYGTVGGKQIPLATDKQAARRILDKRRTDAALDRHGLADRYAGPAAVPLIDHVRDYESHLTAKGNTPGHVRQTAGRISAALVVGCHFARLADLTPAPVTEWLTRLRRNDAPVVVPPGVASFTPAEAAAVLGVSTAAVRAGVKRHRLAAAGEGKARRLPRSTVEALAAGRARGAGPETANHYVRAVRGFCRWLVAARRLPENPLATLTLVNSKTDVRRGRRELTADELRSVLTAARSSPRAFRGLTGSDRYHLYLLAAATGFRARALANLCPSHFALAGAAPTVTLPARFNKSGAVKVQPVPVAVATDLAAYLAGKPPAAPVWGGTWATDKRGAEMLRIDLAAAGVAYETAGPDGPEYADFHALRHTYLTLAGRSGVDLRTLQVLAGHSKPELTARYSHRRGSDLTAAAALPDLTVPDPARPGSGCTPDARPACIPVQFGAVGGSDTSSARADVPTTKHQLSPGFIADSRPFPACDPSEDDGTRTRNHRSDSSPLTLRKPLAEPPVTPPTPVGCSAGCSDARRDGAAPDSELARVVAAWPTLPDPIRRAMLALADAAG